MTPLEAAEQEIRRLQIAKEKLVSGTKYNRIELEKKYFFITENYQKQPTNLQKLHFEEK